MKVSLKGGGLCAHATFTHSNWKLNSEKALAVRLVQMNLRRIFKERWHIINPLGEIVY